MTATLIHSVNLVLSDALMSDAALLIEDGVISAVGASDSLTGPSGTEVVDGAGGFLAPGFIDLHIHGVQDYLIDRGPGDLAAVSQALPTYGVTSFVPTVCPRPEGEDVAFLRDLATTPVSGAAIMGFHLEGPCLILTGALPPEALGPLTPQRLRDLAEAATPFRTIYSIAPDFPDIAPLITLMAQKDTPVFMTHTQANVAQTRAAVEAGARHATHFYDAFPPPPDTDAGVRRCGALEVILADPRVTVDFILDGVHVEPAAVQLALRCKGLDGVSLISDANIGAGLPASRYEAIGGLQIITGGNGAPARLAESGVLAGSGLTLDVALRNAIDMLGLDLVQASHLVSSAPAHVLGLERSKGRIASGFDADLVLLSPDLQVQQTWVGGHCVSGPGQR